MTPPLKRSCTGLPLPYEGSSAFSSQPTPLPRFGELFFDNDSPVSGRANSQIDHPFTDQIKRNLASWLLTEPDQGDAYLVQKEILKYNLRSHIYLDLSGLKITSLPSCLSELNLKTLNCSQCLNLSFLPNLPDCLILDCSQCPNITPLPSLPKCTELDCSACPLLREIPDLSSCASLECSQCPNITTLPSLPECTELSCSDCPFLLALPELSSCIMLDCSQCPSITAIPSLPKCTELICFKCPSLRNIPALALCARLDCSACPNITKLPSLPKCTMLDCSGCPSITMLPSLPRCTVLDCSQCPNITTLSSLPKCTILACSGCASLTTLPSLPRCTKLDCGECSNIIILPGLPRCTFLDCRSCPRLIELPQINAGARVLTDIIFDICTIRWKDLNEDPLKVLRDLLPCLRRGPFPNIVFLNDDRSSQVGYDAGGLRRHLMSQLFAQLSKLGSISKNPGTDLLRPIATNDEDAILEAMGLLFVKAVNAKLPIGQTFHPVFFTDLQAFSGQNMSEYQQDPLSWIQKQYIKKNPDRALTITRFNDLEALHQAYSEYLIPKGLDLEGAKLFILSAFMKETVQEETPWYKAAYQIASAMKGKMNAAWEPFCALSADEFQASIEGSFSKEAFINTIVWEGRTDSMTQAYLINWIDTHDDPTVKELLQFSTGSRSLTKEPVMVMISPPNVEGTFPLPISHTCARQLCIFTGYLSQEMFNAKIKHSLEVANASGFLSI